MNCNNKDLTSAEVVTNKTDMLAAMHSDQPFMYNNQPPNYVHQQQLTI